MRNVLTTHHMEDFFINKNILEILFRFFILFRAGGANAASGRGGCKRAKQVVSRRPCTATEGSECASFTLKQLLKRAYSFLSVRTAASICATIIGQRLVR